MASVSGWRWPITSTSSVVERIVAALIAISAASPLLHPGHTWRAGSGALPLQLLCYNICGSGAFRHQHALCRRPTNMLHRPHMTMDRRGQPSGSPAPTQGGASPLTPAVMVHLYRGVMDAATTWRGRIDGTTNWAVLSSGSIASFVLSDP